MKADSGTSCHKRITRRSLERPTGCSGRSFLGKCLHEVTRVSGLDPPLSAELVWGRASPLVGGQGMDEKASVSFTLWMLLYISRLAVFTV